MGNSTIQRPGWDEYFLRITEQVAKRSTCLRRRVGAVLVIDGHILATGYNGVPKGLTHCGDVGCIRQEQNIPSGERHELCRGLHGEMNALLQAARYGIKIEGATMYTTTYPCVLCAKMIINAGVTRVVTASDYPDDLAKEMLSQAGVGVGIVHPEEAR